MNVKVCRGCGEEKPTSAFTPHKRGKFGVEGKCRACKNSQFRHRRATDPEFATKQATINGRWSKKNRSYFIAYDKKQLQKRREWIDSLKSSPCQDCQRSFLPFVMDFHHRDPADKKFMISHMHHQSKDCVLAEITKCDLLCANCHRIRTWSERVL